MNRLHISDWVDKILEARDQEKQTELTREVVLELIGEIRLACARKTCRSCSVYGKPEIKPGSWVHKKDDVGNFLANPHTCSAAFIWAAELIEE